MKKHTFWQSVFLTFSVSIFASCTPAMIGVIKAKATPSGLTFTILPSLTGNTDSALTQQPVVSMLDKSGAVMGSYSSAITLTAYSDANCSVPVPGGLSAAANPLGATNGSAAFSGLKILKTSVSSILASDGTNSVCKNGFNISAGAPASIAVVSGDAQSAVAGSAVAAAMVAVVKDANGNVVSGATIDWAITSGGGSLSSTSNATLANGQSSSTLTTGTTAGANSVSATVHLTAITVSFSATGTYGTATKLTFTGGQPSATGTTGSALTTQPIVTVQDANGNTVGNSSASVTLALYSNNTCTTAVATAPSGAGSLGGTLAVSATNGITTYSGISVNLAGATLYLGASSSGLTSTCSSVMNITAAAPSTIKFSGNTNGLTNKCSDALITVTTADAYGNVSAVTSNSTFTISGNANTTFWPTATGGCGGASGTTFTINSGQSSGSFQITGSVMEVVSITVNGVAGIASNSMNFTAMGNITVTGPATMATAGGCYAYSVNLVDGAGNPITYGTKLLIQSPWAAPGTVWMKAYKDATCTTGWNAGTDGIPANSSSVTLYISPGRVGSGTINAACPSGPVRSGNNAIAVSVTAAAAPTTMAIIGPTYLINGQCSDPYNIISKDANNNLSNVAGNTDISLSVSAGTASLYSDNTCGTPLGATIRINAGTNQSLPFYVKSAVNNSFTLTATEGSLGSNTFTGSIAASQPNILLAGSTQTGGNAMNCYGVNSVVKCFGNGNINNGAATTYNLSPIKVLGIAGAIQWMAYSTYGALGVIAGGTLFDWMVSSVAGLGRGGSGNAPGAVTLPLTPIQTAVGYKNACAILSDTSLYCWGDGLPAGSLGNAASPTLVTGFSSGVTKVAIGADYICAVKSGALYCWGDNSAYELQTGNTTPSLTPVAIAGFGSGVTDVITQSWKRRVCAVKSGDVYCWSTSSAYGSLGDPAYKTVGSSTPVHVRDTTGASYLTNIVKLASDVDYVCALGVAGQVYCWGINGNYQTGPASQAVCSGAPCNPTPVQINLPSAATDIGTTLSAACAAVGGTVRCWGDNTWGQLGYSAWDNSPNPVAITQME